MFENQNWPLFSPHHESPQETQMLSTSGLTVEAQPRNKLWPMPLH